jgi:CDP-4-dehydro-6-deoxyglucose reductase
MRISLTNSPITFTAARGQTLLDAALAAHINVPHSCKSGNCGSCRARLVRGDIEYPNGRPLGLSDAEIEFRQILTCQARALTDLELDPVIARAPDEAIVKRLPCRIEHAVRLSHDVLALHLRLPAVEAFEFAPGQYVDVMLPGGRRRSFSIASPPHDSKLLELHVRRVAGGEFTAPLFEGEPRNALLTIEGPLGRFVYRESTAPMLLIGGGTGIAPLKSILRHVVENAIERELVLYWGVRGEFDLYAHAELEALARRASRMRYVPVLSEPEGAWAGRSGWVHEAVLADLATGGDPAALQRFDVYASGPPAMISAVREHFPVHGMNPARFFFDSFDYAPDTEFRQRTSAATNS